MLVEGAGGALSHGIRSEYVVGGVDGARHLPREDVATVAGNAVVRTLGIGNGR